MVKEVQKLLHPAAAVELEGRNQYFCLRSAKKGIFSSIQYFGHNYHIFNAFQTPQNNQQTNSLLELESFNNFNFFQNVFFFSCCQKIGYFLGKVTFDPKLL